MGTPAIKVLSSPPLRSVLTELKSEFVQATGHALAVEIGPVAEIKRRIDSGHAFDVAILTSALTERLARDGQIASPPCGKIARAGLGVVVPSGAGKLDVSSVNAFRDALLNAKSILYASGTAVLTHIERTFEQLGIAQSVKPKSLMLPAGGYIARAVADGIAELGLTMIPTVLETPGVELAGSFPAPLQSYVDLSGGLSRVSTRPGVANMLLQMLMAPELTPILSAKGLERVV